MRRRAFVVAGLTWIWLLCGLTAVAGPARVQPGPGAQPPAEPVKRAVLIAVDDYLAGSVKDLEGCANDVDLMRAVLVGKFGFDPEDVLVLKNDEATHQGILDGIRSHLGQSKTGDIALIHYSGHGSQMKDVDGDEVDGMDETIVPHDSRQGGIFDISDDQINDLMSELSEKTENLVFILDSCHSGSAARAADALGTGSTARYVAPDPRDPPPPAPGAEARGLEGVDDFRLPSANYVLISGCRANELSNETRFNDVRQGALTFFLARALRAAGDRATYRDVMEQARADVNARFSKQHPQIEGTGIDTAVFGIERILPRPYVLVHPVGSAACVDASACVEAGEVYGLEVGTELDAYPPGTKAFDGSVSPSGRVRVTGVGPFRSAAEVVGGTVAPHSRAVLERIKPPDFQVAVLYEGLARELESEIAAALSGNETVVETTVAEDADIRVVGSGEGPEAAVFLKGRDLNTLSEIPLSGANVAAEVAGLINHWARWLSVLAIDNPSPDLDIDLKIEKVDDGSAFPAPEVVAPGSTVRISITNNSGQEVFPILLDLTDKGKIGVLYPPADIPDPLPPDQSVSREFTAGLPAGASEVVDHVKAIVTTERISASVFKLGAAARSIASPLERFLRASSQGLTRDLTPVAVTGWATKQRVLRVASSGASTDGFAVHFDAAESAAGVASKLAAGTRSVCVSAAAGDCYEVVPVAGDSTVFEVRTPEVRSGETGVESVGRAFETAYEIRDETGAQRVEPLLQQELAEAASAPVAGDPGTRGLGSEDPLPRARNDTIWSHKYARVPEAWALLAAAGKPAGAVARGVVIAHPDTGYLRHPEIWEPPSDRPILFDKGWDYFAGDDEPIDEKLGQRPLDNPVHGTGSGSAIVSRDGCQLPDAAQCPTGVAQGAHLVPLRINRSVVNFSTRNLTQAILDASGNDRSRIKVDTDLASIAMGGVPSWALWKAVQKAEERGYVIIAAAGNYVRKVIWPARFESVIAVAAVNADCKPWTHSSRGGTVDLAAPGESVWRATLDEDGGDEFVTGMGTGTTYATATTSGVVALWVAKHKGTPAYERLKSEGKLVSTLRRLLHETAWRPGTAGQPAAAECAQGLEWDSGSFGAGIIDAKALLEAPLIEGAVGGERAASVEQLPLWSSLYRDGVPLARRHEDYRRLFGVEDPAALESLAIFESEIMYHYAADEAVAAAIDSIVVRGDRSDAAYARARERLLARDLASRLRRALE
jgi:hypothetical protein